MTDIIFRIIFSIINTGLLCALSIKIIHTFQLGGYRVRRFMAWVLDRRHAFVNRLFALSILGLGSTWITLMFFPQKLSPNYGYIGLIFYFVFAVLLLVILSKTKNKIPLRLTPRVIRLFVVAAILYVFLSYLLLWTGFQFPEKFDGPQLMPLVAVLLPIIILLANCICLPIECLIKKRFLSKAKRKLAKEEYKNLIRIGITGSFGKTSCKNILAEMLSQKYKVLASPASFNTPMGFCKTVNDSLKPEHEVFIMEMGARYRGDIKEMSKLLKPKHGILTGTGSAHLETFGSLENIRAEKMELINALLDDGIRVEGDKIDIDKVIKDIKITDKGCEFTWTDKNLKFETKLLGKHNIKNIIICAIMAESLGITPEKIAKAVKSLEPTPHRLQLIKAENGVNILDDSYNASPDGTIAALEVLKLFGGQKIIMTPGMVELGKNSNEENFKFGHRMAAVADKVIIVNELNRQIITDGLIAGGFDKDSIISVKDLEQAKEVYAPYGASQSKNPNINNPYPAPILKAGDTLLIANDLPDNYR